MLEAVEEKMKQAQVLEMPAFGPLTTQAAGTTTTQCVESASTTSGLAIDEVMAPAVGRGVSRRRGPT